MIYEYDFFLFEWLKCHIAYTSSRKEFRTVINTLIEIQLRFLSQQINTPECFPTLLDFSVKTYGVISIANCMYNYET